MTAHRQIHPHRIHTHRIHTNRIDTIRIHTFRSYTIWCSTITAVVLIAVLSLAGCGLDPAGAFVPNAAPGSIKAIDGLPAGASLTMTSKNHTEAVILSKMAVIAAKVAGFQVTDMSNVPGSVAVRELILNGGADFVWDYTGTAWLAYLGKEERIPDEREQYEAIRDADIKNGLTWLEPAELNNTYAFAARASEIAKLNGIAKLSQIKDLPVSERTFCVEAEFNSRQDGFRPMLEDYGLTLDAADGVPTDNITILDTGTIYEATARGVCNFGEVFTTDGRIVALDLEVLEDDRGFFPAYNVAPILRTETLNKYPQLKQVFAQLSSRLTNSQQQKLNYRVDVGGEEPAKVAFDWMKEEGLITAPTN